MHHLLASVLLIVIASLGTRACVPTRHPEPGIPATTSAPVTQAPCSCTAPAPMLIEDAASGAKKFLDKTDKKCTTWKFVCDGFSMQFNGRDNVSDGGDGVPDGKITVTIDCPGDGTKWIFAGNEVKKIACLG